MRSISVFLDITKVNGKKRLIVAEFLGCNCPKFSHCGICVTDFRKEGLFTFSIREQSQKHPSKVNDSV